MQQSFSSPRTFFFLWRLRRWQRRRQRLVLVVGIADTDWRLYLHGTSLAANLRYLVVTTSKRNRPRSATGYII
jgi:hypothetical protein